MYPEKIFTSIKKTAVFYFSGTGNAEQVAIWLSDFAFKKGIDCKTYNIAACNTYKVTEIIENALILIISPTHGFNYPKITLDFIRRFPKGQNNVVLMNTRAGMKIGNFITPGLTGIALILSAFILKKKGYTIRGQIPFDMPSNWISIHPVLSKNAVQYLHKAIYYRVEQHADKIFSGQRDFHAKRDLVQDILISPFALAYYWIGRFAFAKSFYASADCNSCGMCIQQCPVQAIKMVNSHPFWTYKCESCMRCMNKCPQRAIETAHGLIVITGILNSAGVTFLLHEVLKSEIQSPLVRLAIQTGVFMLLLCIFYLLQHLLLKVRFLSKIISFTSLTHYNFWGRYTSIPDSKWKK